MAKCIINFLISTIIRCQAFFWTLGCVWAVLFIIGAIMSEEIILSIVTGISLITFGILIADIEINHKIAKIVIMLINLSMLAIIFYIIKGNFFSNEMEKCIFYYPIFGFVIFDIILCISLAFSNQTHILSCIIKNREFWGEHDDE